jgi:nucleotide-binding universal stress UspA family protein
VGREIPGNIRVSTDVRVSDDIAEGICEAADMFEADVICLGSSSSRSRIGAALLGSTVQSVMASTHKPVLVVPGDEK